ncbi:MAG: hypothetical protein MJE77_20330 [Proteobacteria bacterium]|nr:hypothetical protein [Pseudomonadota bacterium]
MSLLGVRLSLLIGKTVPVPPPLRVTEALESVQVTHKDKGCSGFQMTFAIGRLGPIDLLDHAILSRVKANMRVIMTVMFGGIPRVLSDGIITQVELQPGDKPGNTRLQVTGEDVSCAMTMKEEIEQHVMLPEALIVYKICAKYAKYGLVPVVIPPLLIDPPLLTDRIPVQRATDLWYLKALASRFGYVFYISPGPVPGLNQAYWGPPKWLGLPQRALTVNMDPFTNVQKFDVSIDSQKAAKVSGSVQDGKTNKKMPVESLSSMRPPLAVERPTPTTMKTVLPSPCSGLTAQQAKSRAQGVTDASFDSIVKARGMLDTIRYNDLLQPRKLVGVRGAGLQFDGLYYVTQVTHQIKRGSYVQNFELEREGLGSLLPILRP